MVRREGAPPAAVLMTLCGIACSTSTYSPCPIEVDGALPADAFLRCKEILQSRFGAFAVVDENAFLLQTAWLATADPPGEQRAAVFRDASPRDPEGLAIVVEVRRLAEPMIGLPTWTAARGDPAAERELAELLRRGLMR
ncbi:MAG: hypothetical protein ABIP94_11605 [Planctomycetota bacterium]